MTREEESRVIEGGGWEVGSSALLRGADFPCWAKDSGWCACGSQDVDETRPDYGFTYIQLFVI